MIRRASRARSSALSDSLDGAPLAVPTVDDEFAGAETSSGEIKISNKSSHHVNSDSPHENQ